MSLTFLQDELVLALCWTLIHSLWQGLLLAAATGIVMVVTRRSHARKRYTVLTALFFLFIAVTIFTFCRELGTAAENRGQIAAAEPGRVKEISAADIAAVAATKPAETGWVERFVDYFNTHAAFIVTIWFIIFLAKFLKLSANLVYVQRLKSYKVYEPAGEWLDTLKNLVNKLNLKVPIRMVESGIVKVPMTMGILKPVILLPLGLLSQLPADEIEAILLHELAHIKRRDYLVNLLQSTAETIFFFNPALLWLSSMIREERENCCDDLAISVTNNKTNFINALISFQEYHLNKPSYAMTFPGNKNQLLNRVKRIISDRNKTLNAAEKSILSFGIALFVLFSFVAAKTVPRQVETGGSQDQASAAVAAEDKRKIVPDNHIGKSQVRPGGTQLPGIAAIDQSHLENNHPKGQHDEQGGKLHPLGNLMPMTGHLGHIDTIPEAYRNISAQTNDDGDTRTIVVTATTREGKIIEFKKVNDVLKAITVNGKQIQREAFAAYEEEIAFIEEAVTRRRELKKLSELDRINQKLLRLQVDKSIAKANADAIEAQKQQMYLDKILDYQKKHKLSISEVKELMKIPKYKWELDSGMTYSADKLKPNGQWKLKKDSTATPDKIPLKLKNPGWKTDKNDDPGARSDTAGGIDLKTDPKGNVTWEPRKKNVDGPSPDKQKRLWQLRRDDEDRRQNAAAVMLSIISDLEKENIKVDKDHSWFALDKERFLVDGKPMPAEIHRRFLSKYVTSHDGLGWYYGKVPVSGRGIFFSSEDIKAK